MMTEHVCFYDCHQSTRPKKTDFSLVDKRAFRVNLGHDARASVGIGVREIKELTLVV